MDIPIFIKICVSPLRAFKQRYFLNVKSLGFERYLWIFLARINSFKNGFLFLFYSSRQT